MPPITLSGLYIYPIKSAAGISLSTGQVETRGLQYDRRWMLVDQAGQFMTQRQHPRMALIQVAIAAEEGRLAIAAPQMPPLSVPLQPNRKGQLSVQVWRDICGAIPLNDEINEWFSRFLNVRCQLVYMPDSSRRLVNHPLLSNQLVSFADGYPFLLISQASLDNLNQQLAHPVPMDRFRPNFVVDGVQAHEEDTWSQIQIGPVSFQVVKPCSRCIMTTVEQSTAVRSSEPLRTLAKYRLWDGQIWFGQNLIQNELGTVQVGETVEVLATRSQSSDSATRDATSMN
ncbi:MAG: MOSC domain-containing protein [Thainema sp.]